MYYPYIIHRYSMIFQMFQTNQLMPSRTPEKKTQVGATSRGHFSSQPTDLRVLGLHPPPVVGPKDLMMAAKHRRSDA